MIRNSEPRGGDDRPRADRDKVVRNAGIRGAAIGIVTAVVVMGAWQARPSGGGADAASESQSIATTMSGDAGGETAGGFSGGDSGAEVRIADEMTADAMATDEMVTDGMGRAPMDRGSNDAASMGGVSMDSTTMDERMGREQERVVSVPVTVPGPDLECEVYLDEQYRREENGSLNWDELFPERDDDDYDRLPLLLDVVDGRVALPTERPELADIDAEVAPSDLPNLRLVEVTERCWQRGAYDE